MTVLAAACGGSGDAASPRRVEPDAGSEPAAERRFVEVRWTDLWTRGGAEADTTLLMPFRLVADGERVYVLDRGAERVAAFALADGRLAWTAGGKGGGPGEFLRAETIGVLATGEVAVADPEANRMTLLDARTGRVRRAVPLDGVAFATSLCGLEDGSLLVSTLGIGKPVALVGREGGIVRTLDLAWPDLRGDRPIRQQGFFVADGEGGCTYLLSQGRGFTRYHDGAFPRAHRYVEWNELPDYEERPSGPGLPPSVRMVGPPVYAAMGAGISGGELRVAFYGTSGDRGRVVDVYDARTGAYRHSYRTTHWYQAAAHAGDVWLFLQERDGYPALVAARVERPAPAR